VVDNGDAKRIALLDDTAIERDPLLDAAIGPALLAAIGRAGGPDRLRLYRTAPTVAFSGRDCATPGIREAAAAAATAGFAAVRRGPGGRAAAYHRGALCLDHVSAEDGRSDIRARFVGFGGLLVDALRAVGTDARLGPVPGEYCPGEFSINDGHGHKLVGTAQRLVRGAWLFGTVVLVTGAEPVRSVLLDTYRALGLDWNPATVGAVEDTVPGVTVADVQRAVLEAYARWGELVPDELPATVLADADGRRDRHRAEPTRT
jgi:lipoate-protein ligase A